MGGFRRRTCQSAKLTPLGAPSVTFKVTARRSAPVPPSVPRCPHVRPAVRSLCSSPPTPAPEFPGRPPPPGPDPLRTPAHQHQLRTHPQRRRADPALHSPDAEPGRPSDPRQRRPRPTSGARGALRAGLAPGHAGARPPPRPPAACRPPLQLPGGNPESGAPPASPPPPGPPGVEPGRGVGETCK